MANDYYANLNVQRSASQEEIQKAYRELARKYHPDLNPDNTSAKKRFQEVQAAFDVVGDPEKRKLYDQYGSHFEAMGGGGTGPQAWPSGSGSEAFPFDLSELFGQGGPGMGGAGGGAGSFADLLKNVGRRPGRQPRPRDTRGAHIRHELTVPFNTAVCGGEASITVRRSSDKEETIHLKIPAGIESGKKIRLRGQGEVGTQNGKPGDILIAVQVSPHPYFQRTGKRLDIRVPVTLAEAVMGAKIDVPTPQGTIALTVPPGTSSGTRLRIKGHGVRPKGKTPGDMFAEILIVLPEQISEEQKKQLADVFVGEPKHPRSELRW